MRRAKFGGLMETNAVKAILFIVMALVVFLFLSKLYSRLNPPPDWSKSLDQAKFAIDQLDEEYPDQARSANINVEDYHIEGFSDCPQGEYCICACSSVECLNKARGYCRQIDYEPDIYIEEGVVRTFQFSLEPAGETYKVVVIGS